MCFQWSTAPKPGESSGFGHFFYIKDRRQHLAVQFLAPRARLGCDFVAPGRPQARARVGDLGSQPQQRRVASGLGATQGDARASLERVVDLGSQPQQRRVASGLGAAQGDARASLECTGRMLAPPRGLGRT